MIIFDLDSLANNEHRRHFIEKPWDCCNKCYTMLKVGYEYPEGCECGRNPFTWKEDYKAYNEACDKDEPIREVNDIYYTINYAGRDEIFIWSSRNIYFKVNTETWLTNNDIYCDENVLKMRPIDDNSPQEQLFERWLDELIKNDRETYDIANRIPKYPVDFVFSSHKKTIEMFRRRGVFVFDCNQGE